VALGLSVGGLASYLIGFCCAPLAIIGLILCGVGLFMGYRETQAIEHHLADPAGRGTARAAQIVGGIGVGLFVVVLLLFGFFFGASALL
jgi:pheromone shutdown protein TraB